MKIFNLLLLCVSIAAPAFGIPDNEDFRIVTDFPQPAPGSFSVVGTSTLDGRFLVWNGDEVFLQNEPGGAVMNSIASGYLGDPGFLTLNPAGDMALLGQGFGDGSNANLYLLDLNSPSDFVSGDAIVIQSHFSGVHLSANLVALDRGDFGFPAEIIVVDLLARRDSRSRSLMVLELPEPPAGRTTVITKPPGSFSASLAVNGGLLYVADSGNGQYKTFAVADVIDAFDTATPLLWSAGTDIGTPFQYPLGGVSGFTAAGNLVIAGFGSIVEVDSSTGTIVKTLDPAGTSPFYGIIYNSSNEELIAIEFPALFGDPLIFHASVTAIAPESPCADFDAIDAAFVTFRDTFFSGSNDIDADAIPDTAMLELIELFCLRGIDEPLVLSADTAYDINLDAFDAEASSAALESFREVIALLMTMSQAMQDNLRTALAASGNPLFGAYSILFCSDLENCLPEFSANPDPILPLDEPYSAQGDPDGDGISNLQEYQNVVAMGGDDFDFAVAASNDQLDGTSGTRNSETSGCLIATAAYGTPLAGEIDVLRSLRDRYMLRNALGMAFVDTYYRVSPPLADLVASEPALASLVRAMLHPLLIAARSAKAALTLTIMLSVMAMIALRLPAQRRGQIRNE
ncbi:MAG: hypothetical protein QGD90_10770 [Candidatus Hydrogenedentes bacterium]|nr:hypothetical protein [Candidatus Hydrogenedentota bacterium]